MSETEDNVCEEFDYEGDYPDDVRAAEAERKLKNSFTVTQTVSKKLFMATNLYYLRRFFGIRELIAFVMLLAAAVATWILLYNPIFFAFFGVITVLIAFAAGMLIFTAHSGFKREFLERGVTVQKLYFDNVKIRVESYAGENLVSGEEFLLTRVDKIAVRKDIIYIYPMTAVCFYVTPDSVEGGTFEEFRQYLGRNFPETTFKLRKKVKQFPKNVLNK